MESVALLDHQRWQRGELNGDYTMTINELKGFTTLKTIKPMTPEKSRIDSLKRTKDTATKNLKGERDRQKLARAQQQIADVTTSIPKL